MKSYAALPTSLAANYTPLPAAPAKGGLIIKIAKGSVPADVASAKSQAIAAQAIGWTAKTISYDGSLQDFNTKFAQAISENPTVISSAAPVADVNTIKPLLAQAKSKGIVVSLSGINDADMSYPGFAASSQGLETFPRLASIMSNYALKESNCDVHAAVVPLTGIAPLETEANDVKKDITSACSACSAQIIGVDPTTLESPAVTTAIVSALQANPKINYLILTLGNIADGLSVAIKQAGITSVKIVGSVPDSTNIAELKAGTNDMWVDLSVDMNGWTELDAALRALAEKKAVSGLPFPLSVLTASNISTPGAIGPSGVPTYPAKYQSLFKTLWHVG